MRLHALFAFATASITALACAEQGSPDVEKFITSIRSVHQVKAEIGERMAERCGTGACFNNNAMEICSYLGALDIQLDSQISNTNPQFRPTPKLKITASDLSLMKRIWRQCKPTTYQYWSYGVVLHVIYDPPEKEGNEIRRLLGAKK